MSDTDARLHALHWAFFVDTLDMEFEDLHQIFLSWCESVPADEMARIMAMGDELFGDNDDDDNIDDDDDDDEGLDPWNENNVEDIPEELTLACLKTFTQNQISGMM